MNIHKMIAVLIIISGVGLYAGGNSINKARNNKLKSELEIVQHAALETYVTYNTTQNNTILKGTEINVAEAEIVANQMGVTLKGEGTYYRLSPDDLKEIGALEATDTYIVNYDKGIVFCLDTVLSILFLQPHEDSSSFIITHFTSKEVRVYRS